jgi:hypothetical protein
LQKSYNSELKNAPDLFQKMKESIKRNKKIVEKIVEKWYPKVINGQRKN